MKFLAPIPDIPVHLENPETIRQLLTHDVGGKQANQFCLHDMHGNVLEWCEDVYKSDFYADDVPGFDPGFYRCCTKPKVFRGGNFNLNAQSARSARRVNVSPWTRFNSLGFRPARPLP